MESECVSSTLSTLFAVGIGAAIPMIGWMVFHFLASNRERNARLAAAAQDFRKSILSSTSGIPENSNHWPNDLLARLKTERTKIETACQIYKYFMSGKRRRRFLQNASELSQLISKDLPEPKTEQELDTAGGIKVPRDQKAKFHELRQKLLDDAQST